MCTFFHLHRRGKISTWRSRSQFAYSMEALEVMEDPARCLQRLWKHMDGPSIASEAFTLLLTHYVNLHVLYSLQRFRW